jgi:hypothetical protein
MPAFQLVLQPARRFRDNLKATRHRVETQVVILERLVSGTPDEAFGHRYVVLSVIESAMYRFRVRSALVHVWTAPRMQEEK